jgi:transaldolase
MNANPLLALKRHGQQVWLDNLSRTLLHDGTLRRLIDEDGVSGVTSNPAIFQKAVAESPYYREEFKTLKASTRSAEARYEALAIPDIRAACDLLTPVFDRTLGDGGYVSLEVSPQLAHDEEGTIEAARRLKHEVARPNVLIKVPATPAGIRAFERLIAEGINVNVTLMFSVRHEDAVGRAYIRGARRWVENGGNPGALKSVASIFMSRIDTLVDKRLAALNTTEARALRGKAAVAVGKLAYRHYLELFRGPEFAKLASAGVRPQHPLWASTGTKNPEYNDVLYVEPLVGPETVNTMPDATLAAFRGHGEAQPTLELGVDQAAGTAAALHRLGIDLDAVGEELQIEGVKLFVDAFDKLLAMME